MFGLIADDFVIPESGFQPVEVLSDGKTIGPIQAKRILPDENGGFLQREAARIEKESNGILVVGRDICKSESCTGMYYDYSVRVPRAKRFTARPTILLKRPIDQQKKKYLTLFFHESSHLDFARAGKTGKGFSFSVWLENTGPNVKRDFYHKGLSLEENFNFSRDFRREMPAYDPDAVERAFRLNPRGLPRSKVLGVYSEFSRNVRRFRRNVHRAADDLPVAIRSLASWEDSTAEELLKQIARVRKNPDGKLDVTKIEEFFTFYCDEARTESVSIPLNTNKEWTLIHELARNANYPTVYPTIRSELFSIWRQKLREQLNLAKRLKPRADRLFEGMQRWRTRKFIRYDEYSDLQRVLDQIENTTDLKHFEHPEWWIPPESSIK